MSQPQSGEVATLMQKLAQHVAGGLTPQQGAEVAGMLSKLAQHVGAPAAEVSQLDRFFQSLRRVGFHPTHVVDVGAHRGGWTRTALGYFPDAHFTLVEPQPGLRADMEDLLRNPRVRLHSCGAGPTTGELAFTLHQRADSRSFAFSAEQAAERGFEQVMVPVETIDGLVARSGWGPPEIVKIDAEGYDLEVLKGAAETLRSCEVLLMEAAVMSKAFTNDVRSVVERAAEAGFRPYDVTDLNRTAKHGALWLVELAFVRAGGAIDRAVDSFS